MLNIDVIIDYVWSKKKNVSEVRNGEMINSKKILYSKGNNDECLAPDSGVKPIIKYIPKKELNVNEDY